MEDVVNLKKISCDMMSGLEKSEEELSNIKNLQLKFCYEKEKDGKRWNGETSQAKLSDVEESSVNLCKEQENEKQVELNDGNGSKFDDDADPCSIQPFLLSANGRISCDLICIMMI